MPASSARADARGPDRVLIVTYLFPPVGGVGVPRFVSYSKYLPEHGCDVHVLTVRKPATPAYDEDLARQVPAQTQVFRAFNPEVPYSFRDRLWKKIIGGSGSDKAQHGAGQGRAGSLWKRAARRAIQWAFCPDVQILWTPFAIRAARRIIRQQKITTVLVNLPPYSCLKIAVEVKRRFPEVKLILDFRDEWIENYLAMFDNAATPHKLEYAKRLEREAVTRADYVAAVTRAQLGQIRRRYPEEPEEKFLYAPNGYDPDLYSRLQPSKHAPGKMVVAYFGTVYDNPAYRPVFDFLDAIEELPEEIRNAIEVWFIGRVAKEAAPLLERRGNRIRCFGFMTQTRALEYLGQADYNLIVGGNPTTHAGKLFDYLASGKPMLAICDDHSEIAKVIRETRSGVTAPLGDRAATVQMIRTAFERLAAGELAYRPDWEEIRFYSWPKLVARMAKMAGLGNYRSSSDTVPQSRATAE
jgi:hypothetical protein